MPKFKVGDVVRVLAKSDRHEFSAGEHVRITRDPDMQDEYRAEHLDKSDWWYIEEGDVEALAPAPTPEEIAAAPASPPSDPVNPVHYSRFKIQPIDFILQNDLPFDIGCIVKYALRYDAKDGIQDLEKAKRYLDFRIALLRGATSVAA